MRWTPNRVSLKRIQLPSSLTPFTLGIDVDQAVSSDLSQGLEDWSAQDGFFANWIDNMEWADFENPLWEYSPHSCLDRDDLI